MTEQITLLWIALCTALVLLMQVGFCFLESGLVRDKNSINVAAKNLLDFCASGAMFALFGYGIMFGDSAWGFFGTNQFFFPEDGPKETAIFLFQLVFCSTAVTIISGAVSERMSFRAYIIVASLVGLIFYPVVGHWIWKSASAESSAGWLAQIGFIDFAGASVVHSTGAWLALACVIIIGPRIGRFDSNSPIRPHNLSIAVSGCLILVVGWFGFNGGSAYDTPGQIPLVLVNTLLAAIFGGCATFIYCWAGKRQVQVLEGINGVLAGMVSVTASALYLSPMTAAIIGFMGSIIALMGMRFFASRKIDDVVGAISVHGIAGVFGTLIFPFFIVPADLGIKLTAFELFQIQLFGVFVIFLWAFGGGYTILRLLNYIIPLRVSRDAELLGLNHSEHDATTPTRDLLREMELQTANNNFENHVNVDPHTDVGMIATQYNRILDRVKSEAKKSLNATKKAEAARSYAEKSLEIKDQFVAAMSHELRTPLTAMKGSIDILLAYVIEELSPALRNQLELISRNITREKDLVEKILNLQALDMDNIKLDIKAINVRTCIEQVIKEIKVKFPMAASRIYVSSNQDELMVESDVVQLKKVIAELIENAILATDDTQGIKVFVKSENRKIKIHVKDNGVGISDKVKDMMFKPFVQADTSNTRATGGLGVGLAIAKNTIKAMSGDITFSSQEGVGWWVQSLLLSYPVALTFKKLLLS